VASSQSTDSSTAVSPVDEFSNQLEQFRKSVPELNKKIQDGAATIDGTSDVAKARADIEALRDEVSTLLGAVADNGRCRNSAPRRSTKKRGVPRPSGRGLRVFPPFYASMCCRSSADRSVANKRNSRGSTRHRRSFERSRMSLWLEILASASRQDTPLRRLTSSDKRTFGG